MLLVVLSLLVLFMLIGTAFLMTSNQYRHGAAAAAKLDRLGTPPTKSLDRALMQVLCDTGNPRSVIRFHSLLRDLYGSEGFEAEVYQPRTVGTTATPPLANQATRFASAINGTPADRLGPTQGQLIDIYVKVLTFGQNDPVTTSVTDNEATLLVPDTRHGLKLEPNVNGQPQPHQFPLTKGYYNGCLLTMTSGPAAGQSTRIVDYEYLGDLSVNAGIVVTRLFRFRVMAFPRSDGSPLTIDTVFPPEIKDLVITPTGTRTAGGTVLRGQRFIVNGRPFNGTGAGFNELAKAGEPRLNAVEVMPNPTNPTDPTKSFFPQVALTPNAAFTLLTDPFQTGNDTRGVGYFTDPTDPATWLSLNPKSIAPASRPLLWKYQTFVGPGDADESYDAPDFQNMALALQTVTPRARGRVVQGPAATPVTYEIDAPQVRDANGIFTNTNNFLRLDLEDLPIPSYHRPDLENYWFHKLIAFVVATEGVSESDAAYAVLTPYGPDNIRDNADDPTSSGVSLAVRDQIVAVKRKISLRPLGEDHPHFDGSNPASRPPALDGVSPLVRNGNIAVPFWDAVGPWDVDNDNDGVPDSVWVDLGDPVAQAEDGTLYKPLYAFLIVDLDSRLNVNAHGLVDHLRSPQLDSSIDQATGLGAGNLAHDLTAFSLNSSNYLASGSGYGPADISLRSLFSPNLPGNSDATLAARVGNPAYDDYARLLVGRPAFVDQQSVWGRHGSVNIRGIATIDWTNNANALNETNKVRPGMPFDATSPASQAATLDKLTAFKFFGYPLWLSSYNADLLGPTANNTPSAFSTAPDLMGRYALGLDYAGQPVSESRGEMKFDIYWGQPDSSLLYDTPYELDLSNPTRRDTPDPSVSAAIKTAPLAAVNDDAPFATADLERVLRAHDADSGILPDRLWNVVDAFDPLKLIINQPAAVTTLAQQMFNLGAGSPTDPQALAAAQQMAEIDRRVVTTDSYDLPTADSSLLSRLVYGADGQPGIAGQDDNKNGILDDLSGDDDGNGVGNDSSELGWQNSDDWYTMMYRTPTSENPNPFNGSGAPTPAVGIRLAPDHPTLVDLLKYRIQYERWKHDASLVVYTEAELSKIVNELLSPELLAGGKLDLNRPFGDGVDTAADGINNNSASGDLRIDEPSEPGDPYVNGIVDDPFEAGEPFLDRNGNGKRDDGTLAPAEVWIDVNADGNYNPPIDKLWDGLTGEPIAFDYTNGQAVPLHSATGVAPVEGGGVRNLNSQSRQLYARQLYCLMMLLMDENYLEMPDVPSIGGDNLNLELQRIQLRLDWGLGGFDAPDANDIFLRRKLTAQRIAQWAINVVDFRDADSIMTPFEYDENPWDGWGCFDSAATPENIPLDGDIATNENLGQVIDWNNVTPQTGASNPPKVPIITVADPPIVGSTPAVDYRTRGVVWGAERPELLITETLAMHDRRCTDEPDFGSVAVPPPANATPDQRDYDLDQRLKPRGSLFVELYNPSSPDGSKPTELYGVTPDIDPSTPGNQPSAQGVMLNRLSDLADPTSGNYSPVWRMSVLREPLNGRMPVFKNAKGRLDSGVLHMVDDPSTVEVEGFEPADIADRKTVTADFLTIDPDGYNVNMDEAAERQVYFTTGRNYATGNGSDANRSNDDNAEYDPTNPLSAGEWQFRDATGVLFSTMIPPRPPIPVVNQLHVRVPPLPQPRQVVVGGTTHIVPIAKRYFIARNERVDDPVNPNPNDIDATIAPILPGRYAAIGSSGLQLRGLGPTTSRADDGQVADRFVLPISRDATQPEDGTGDAQTFGRLPDMRRIELWPNLNGNPNIQQVLVAENGGPEFVRLNNNTVYNATDADRNGDPTNAYTPANPQLIDPAVAIPVEDLSVSEPVDGYPSITYRQLYEKNTPVGASGNPIPFPEPPVSPNNPRPTPSGEGVYSKPYEVTAEGDLAYAIPYDRPLDTEFELIRNGTTQNYRSIHLQRLANPTLPWNPMPFDSAGQPNPMHRPWLPVNPYRTIDSQSVDITAYNGASQLERTLPVTHTDFNPTFTTSDPLQANILAPITATQFLDAPDHEIWAMILLMKLKGISIGDSPTELRAFGAANINNIENPLNELEDIEPAVRGELTALVQEVLPPTQKKFPTDMVEGWSWHMNRRVLPDDQLPNSSPNSFRQWLHFKSLERGFHTSNYFKYPKPGASYAMDGGNPPELAANLEGWAPDLSVLPRTLWKQERPNARMFLRGTSGIVDASDLKTVTSRLVLSGATSPGLTDAEITRNQLVWNNLKASTTGNEAVFDYVMEQTLGFMNESFAPDLERVDVNGSNNHIANAMLSDPTTSPRIGAPEVAVQSNVPNRRPAKPVTFGTVDPLKEIRYSQRRAAKLNGVNLPDPQDSLHQAIVDNGMVGSPIELRLTNEFYERRRLLMKSTFPWLAWNDRPLVSADEIMQVPASSSSLMLRDYSLPNLFTPDASVAVIVPPTPAGVAMQVALQHAPFGHLLNLFTSATTPAVAITNPLDATGPPNFNRILDYVEVPSRYVGTDTLLSPEIFNDVPVLPAFPSEPVGTDISGPTDPRYKFQPPFNKVSRQRDPGRVNLNTVTGRRRVEPSGFIRHWSEVYDGIMHRYGDGNLVDAANNVLQLSHFGPAWRDVELSRRGYAQYNADGSASPVEKLVSTQIQPETFALGLNPNFPSVFSNPFRSADAGDLVPLPNMIRPGIEATWLRGQHWQRAQEDSLKTNPFASTSNQYNRIAWGLAGVDDDLNGTIDDIREAGFGIIDPTNNQDGDTLRVKTSANNALESSGIPLFSEQVPEPAIDAERNPGMMYQPMTRLGNLVTTRSNVYAIWVTVGYFEVERAPEFADPDVQRRFGGDGTWTSTTTNPSPESVRARALYDRVYPDGYTLGEELGTDTGNTNRQRAFYIIDRTEPVGFKPGEDLNADKMIRVRRRIE